LNGCAARIGCVEWEAEFWGFLGGIWLIFVGRGGNFKFLRGLHHVGLFLGNGEMAEKLPFWVLLEKKVSHAKSIR